MFFHDFIETPTAYLSLESPSWKMFDDRRFFSFVLKRSNRLTLVKMSKPLQIAIRNFKMKICALSFKYQTVELAITGMRLNTRHKFFRFLTYFFYTNRRYVWSFCNSIRYRSLLHPRTNIFAKREEQHAYAYARE